MVITAKYAGKCHKCGGAIDPGEQINWQRGQGAEHVECPQDPKPAPDTWRTSRGQGYGGQDYTEGEIVFCKGYEAHDGTMVSDRWGTVVKTWSRYIREDGMSFGVGDEQGYLYCATLRPSTEEEITTEKQRRAKIAEAKATKAKQADAVRQLHRLWETVPEAQRERPKTEFAAIAKSGTLYEFEPKSILYGGGWWLVLTDEGPVWLIFNNGHDGDDWSRNNISTWGAGAIGIKLPATCRPEAIRLLDESNVVPKSQQGEVD